MGTKLLMDDLLARDLTDPLEELLGRGGYDRTLHAAAGVQRGLSGKRVRRPHRVPDGLSWYCVRSRRRAPALPWRNRRRRVLPPDRKSTRLNSSHANISYAVFC